MDEFFEKIKKGAFRAKDEAEKITKTVVKKSSNLVEQTKINYAINETESKANEVLCEIGKYVYDKYINGTEFSGDVGEQCARLDDLYKEIGELKKQFAQAKESIICSDCGEYNNAENAFCSKCGTKLNKE